jgi:hypothetical protein
MEENTENFLLVCFDPSSQLFLDIKQFENLINNIQSFDNVDICIDYITNIKYEKIFFIISFDQMEILSLIHQISQINLIYIICSNDHQNTEFDLSKYRKVRGLFKTLDEIYRQMNNDIKSFIKLNILSTSSTILQGEINESKNDIQEATFMYSKVLRDIFLTQSYNENDKIQMIEFLREQYKENKTELEKIENFYREYQSEKAIYWYTIDGFLYRIINKALRNQDIITLYYLRYFLKDLHLQLEKYYFEQSSNSSLKTFSVYRGVGLTNDQFEKLEIGGLVSFSEYLSTSKKQELAQIYILRETNEIQPILFEIQLDYSLSTSSIFADISHLSQFDLEDEILFSMGSVFRIQSLQWNDYWNIKLISTSDEDPQLKLLYQWTKNAVYQNKNLYLQLAGLMLFIYDYDKADFFLRKLLNEPNFSQDSKSLSATSAIFAEIHFQKKNYQTATQLYEKLIEIFHKYPEDNQPSTIQRVYTGLSEIYLEKGDYNKGKRDISFKFYSGNVFSFRIQSKITRYDFIR